MNKHLMVGPLPPEEGGITLLFSTLVTELSNYSDFKLSVVNINFTSLSATNKLLRVIYSYIQIMFRSFSSDSISFHLTARSVYIYGPLIVALSLCGRKVIFRKFAGSFDLEFEERSFYYKFIVKLVFKLCFITLLETQHLIDYFTHLFPSANIKKLPNHRQLGSLNLQVNTPYRYIYLGSINPSKGVDLLVELYGSASVLPEIDLYGSGDNILINKIAKTNGLNYRGVLNNENVMETLSTYDYLILPTKHKGEGIPGVIIEAMSCGVVPIVSNWRSLPEIVNEKGGFLFECNDILALKSVITTSSKLPVSEFTLLQSYSNEVSQGFDNAYWVKFYAELVTTK